MLTVELSDPVPYLDILGVAEGCILIICASLPTLGPLVRATRGKLTTTTGHSSQPVSGDSGHGGSSWSNLKGHKLGNVDVERVSSNMHSSVDDIPLVRPSGGREHRTGAIQKKTEFTLAESGHTSG